MNRDLDAQIAEEIKKWVEVAIGKDYDGQNECTILYSRAVIENDLLEYLPRRGKIHRGWLCPRWSGDHKQACDLWYEVVGLDLSYRILHSQSAEAIARAALTFYQTKQLPEWARGVI